MHHSINNKLIGPPFIGYFILRTSVIFAVEGDFLKLQNDEKKRL